MFFVSDIDDDELDNLLSDGLYPFLMFILCIKQLQPYTCLVCL